MVRGILRRTVLAAALVIGSDLAVAGTPCEGRDVSPESARMALELADVTRAGQDFSKYQLTYSHMAFAVRAHPAGAWSVVHKLNACGTATSALYDEDC